MRRLIRSVLVAIAIGAAINTIISLTTAKILPGQTNPAQRTSSILVDERGDHWMGIVERSVGWQRAWVFGVSGLTEHGRRLAEPSPIGSVAPSDDPDNEVVLRTISSGWPLYSFVAWQRGLDDTEADIARTGVMRTGVGPQATKWRDWRCAWVLNDDPASPKSMLIGNIIPLRPIWRGFLANTVLFAGFVWLLVAGPRAVRAILRRRRGLCLKCAYDLRGTTSGVCPECGWASRRSEYEQSTLATTHARCPTRRIANLNEGSNDSDG